ncbi:MAG: hydrolase [Gammaproteobacteria bacterium]|nr:hydrolase [Gammaproteobacteria bacterium]
MTTTNSFRPPWWLPGAHLQTLWPHICRRLPLVQLIDERLELPDGDFVDLCWTQKKSDAIVVVLHGLEGCIRSPYVMGIMSAIDQAGWQGVFMHFRGCSGVHNRRPRSYHSGETGDLNFLLKTLAQRYPGVPLGAVGYSLGANALLKYLGEDDNEKHLTAAVAVSVPFLLASGAERLERGLSRFYQRYLLRRLQHKITSKFRTMASPVTLNSIARLNTFRLFDDQITAPLHGFKDVDDYYSRCSSRQFLKNIKLPTLIIHAADDPFMTQAAIPASDELAETIQFELSDKGGHVGFINGNLPWRPNYWLEKRIPEFLQTFMDH